MPPYRRRTKKAYKPKARPKSAPSKSMEKAMEKVATKIFHRNSEDKQAFNAYNLVTFNSSASTSSDILMVLPSIQQGTQEHQRIGDDIRAKTLKVKGHFLSTMPPSLAYSRIGVRMVICQPKLTASNTLVNATAAQWLPYVLRIGGSNKGLDGSIESLYAPIDTDVVTCYHDEVYYISQPTSYSNIAFQETRYSTKMFEFNLKVKNKLLQYNSNFSSGNFPINYSPSILFSYVLLDGSTPVDGVLQSNILSMAFYATLEYEDA